MKHITLLFYLGLKNEPWFGPAGSENARKHHVATELKIGRCQIQVFSATSF